MSHPWRGQWFPWNQPGEVTSLHITECPAVSARGCSRCAANHDLICNSTTPYTLEVGVAHPPQH